MEKVTLIKSELMVISDQVQGSSARIVPVQEISEIDRGLAELRGFQRVVRSCFSHLGSHALDYSSIPS